MLNRSAALERLRSETFDLLVIGGGVTGAAILWEASRRGLRAALVERNDFASGTSSRSSKLVHGGLRYLRERRIGLTRESVRERQELLRDAPGLVDPIGFVMPHYQRRKPSRLTLAAGLALYDALAGQRQHRYAGHDETLALVPNLNPDDLTGAHWYLDATTDDARLVLRLLQEACDAGAVAVNYAAAEPILESGNVAGALLAAGAERVAVRVPATIAATGAFADALRERLGATPRLRPLRGSHLLLPDWRLPLAACVAFEHPHDRRPVFAYPWMGATLVGTTDLDHDGSLDDEPAISPEETAYLVAAIRFAFPSLCIDAGDAVATYAGVRPVVDAGAGDPSKASRDHVVWVERGLITITGGKLTTFRPMAMDALAAAAPSLPAFDLRLRPVFSRTLPPEAPLRDAARQRLAGRYGSRARDVIAIARDGELEEIDSSGTTWAELRWAARCESVEHLDDLLLRRTRLGLVAAEGGSRIFERAGTICRPELGWSDGRWSDEVERYRALHAAHYGLPPAASIPDFRGYL